MNDGIVVFWVILIGVLAGLVLTFSLTASLVTYGFEHQAIERGYALYCPDTGNFAWKGECGE